MLSLALLDSGGLTIAWYAHTLFKLFFGARDQVSAVLDEHPVSEEQREERYSCRRVVLLQHLLTRKPLYCFTDDGAAIALQLGWSEYPRARPSAGEKAIGGTGVDTDIRR